MKLEIAIDATPERVWEALSDLSTHSKWMSDATAIEFLSGRTSGVGTRMRVPTRVGPFRTDDIMTVTVWDEGRLIEARHEGVVTGLGRFELHSRHPGAAVVWSEDLTFPWWMGGRLGAVLARPILRRIWRGNLTRFKDLVEKSGQSP